MKTTIRFALIIFVAFLLAVSKLAIISPAISVIYTLCGIMFPLGVSQTLSFSFSSIQSDEFVSRYRSHIIEVRKLFFYLFVGSTFLYVINSVLPNIEKVSRFVLCFTFTFHVYTVIHAAFNFIKLTKLKDELDDIIRKQV